MLYFAIFFGAKTLQNNGGQAVIKLNGSLVFLRK